LKLLKKVLQSFLGDYLRIVEPDAAEHIDLASLVFPDLAGPLPPDLAGLLVAEARSREGEQLVILVLVEPEPLGDPAIARRLRQVFAAVDVRLGRPVLLSFLFLRGDKPSVNLGTAPVTSFAGLDNLRLYFSALGMDGAAAEHYLDRPEPLAWGLAALMQTRRLDRSQLEHACRKRIERAALDVPHRRLLLRCVRAGR
jgi:hypothetical protein